MPPLTRWFIRTGLLYLVLSLVTGVLSSADSVLRLPYPLAGLMPLYFQLLMVGWITQLIFGVANWMFPIYTREEPRGKPILGWISYALINASLLLLILAHSGSALGAFSLEPWATTVAASCQLIAASAFVANTWNRVKRH